MARKWKRITAVLLAVTLVLTGMPGELGKIVRVTEKVRAETTLQNPRIVPDDTMEAGQKVTWDCIWFGSYPQTEIVDKPETCGTSQTIFGKKSDYIVDTDLYQRLSSATEWDEANNIVIDGEKYRRMTPRESGVSGLHSWITFKPFADGENEYCFFSWDEYHYFRYEKIKWRVLNVTNDKALLLSDRALDTKPFHNGDYRDKATWKSCTIRSWLNGYEGTQNLLNNDYSKTGFLPNAFSSEECMAIFTENLKNDMTIGWSDDYAAGENTDDRVFFLADSDIYHTERAVSYGFSKTALPDDEARGYLESSTYAKAMGKRTFPSDTDVVVDGWWLRTTYTEGEFSGCAKAIDEWTGSVGGRNNNAKQMGVRPSLYIDLTKGNLWTYAGTVQVSRNIAKNIPVEEVIRETKINSIKLSGVSKQVAAGKKIQLKAAVLPKNAKNKKLKWTSSDTKIATVTQSGMVTIKKKTGGKSVIIKATATDGSKKYGSWKIKVMKGEVKKIGIKGAKKSLKAGKAMKLKAVVKATKGANKKVQWTSSNKKYATVSSSGKVKALTAGKGKTAKITAMATDGTNRKKVVKIKIK